MNTDISDNLLVRSESEDDQISLFSNSASMNSVNKFLEAFKIPENSTPKANDLDNNMNSTKISTTRDPAAIERSNLVNICKLVVKELLEQSLRFGRMLDSDYLPLQHFFIVLEHVLRHGLRPKKGLLGPKKELWDILQIVEKYCLEAQDITATVRDLPTVKTYTGRARAWLRIALMQKKLADYLHVLIEQRDEALAEYYEPHALIMSDEVMIITGILVGLNVIDCNLCVKEEDLDSQQGVIDFSLYLRSSSRNSPDDDINAIEGPKGSMTAVLDQKNYIEELNRHLNATVTNLQAKVETLTTTNALMKEDLAIARNSVIALQAENVLLKKDIPRNIQQSNLSHSSDNGSINTIDTDNIVLTDERRKILELEKELKLQISLKAESDMAMKLLEKDIHEKQDTIISLRRQLEDIKQINLEMYKKLQECESSLEHKTNLVSKLEIQKDEMANALTKIEKDWLAEKSASKNLQHTQIKKLSECEERAARAEADSRVEKEWRISLQNKEVKLKEQVSNLQTFIQQLKEETKKTDNIKNELWKVRKQWHEAQTTLEELGIQLSLSKLQVSELQEKVLEHEKSSTSENSSPWTPDNEITNCKSCNREFSITRRKHHCRNCGEIFCKTCSEQVATLPTETGQLGKPVRVCNDCWKNITKSKK